MQFHSSIYRALARLSPDAARHFLSDYKAFRANRTLFAGSDFELVANYFFNIFNVDPIKYAHQLRCISGNRNRVHWVEDFNTVIAPTYIENYKTLGVCRRESTESLISELGMLLGTA